MLKGQKSLPSKEEGKEGSIWQWVWRWRWKCSGKGCVEGGIYQGSRICQPYKKWGRDEESPLLLQKNNSSLLGRWAAKRAAGCTTDRGKLQHSYQGFGGSLQFRSFLPLRIARRQHDSFAEHFRLSYFGGSLQLHWWLGGIGLPRDWPTSGLGVAKRAIHNEAAGTQQRNDLHCLLLGWSVHRHWRRRLQGEALEHAEQFLFCYFQRAHQWSYWHTVQQEQEVPG